MNNHQIAVQAAEEFPDSDIVSPRTREIRIKIIEVAIERATEYWEKAYHEMLLERDSLARQLDVQSDDTKRLDEKANESQCRNNKNLCRTHPTCELVRRNVTIYEKALREIADMSWHQVGKAAIYIAASAIDAAMRKEAK